MVKSTAEIPEKGRKSPMVGNGGSVVEVTYTLEEVAGRPRDNRTLPLVTVSAVDGMVSIRTGNDHGHDHAPSC